MKTFILAVTGPTNAGKSYFTDILIENATEKGIKVSSISSDEFYRDLSHLKMEDRNKVNYDHPDSIDETDFISALEGVSKGLEVEIPIYDYSKHNRKSEKRKIKNVELLIVEGIFALTFDEIDKFYSLRVYIDMDDDIRVIRRIQRDIEDRGRTLDSVINQYMDTVKPTQQEYVQMDRDKVDIILKGNRDHSMIIEIIVSFVLNN